MAIDKPKVASLSTIKRLPVYLHLLEQFSNNGREFISSTHIAEGLNLQPDQVRKDLSVTGIVGKPKAGYHIPVLIEAIESFLNWNNTTEALLVGAGNLGSALLGYKGFAQNGLNIVAAFDTDETKVGRVINEYQVLPLEKLNSLASRMLVRMGIITVPADQAQQVADMMVEAGIVAIWNFAQTTLQVPPGVIVQNEDLSSGFAVLSVRLAKSLQTEKESLLAQSDKL